LSDTHTTNARTIARSTRNLVRSVSAKFSGKERAADRPIHRNSYDVNDRRAQVAKRCADGTQAGTLAFVDSLLRTAREFDLEERNVGNPRPLRLSGIRVLEEVLRNHWHDFKTGEIDPALSQLERATGFVRQTIVEALKRLRKHGFLDWVRRTEIRLEDQGPRRKQINNAYFVDLARLPSRVLARFNQLYRNQRARQMIRKPAPASPAPSPSTSEAAPQAAPTPVQLALASLGRAVFEASPSMKNSLSPSKGN
jgi:hypothetical protein